jgi:hypothetical protein
VEDRRRLCGSSNAVTRARSSPMQEVAP